MRHPLLSCLIGLLMLLTLSAVKAGDHGLTPADHGGLTSLQAWGATDSAEADLSEADTTEPSPVGNDDRTEQHGAPAAPPPALVALQPVPQGHQMAPLEAWPQALLRPPRAPQA